MTALKFREARAEFERFVKTVVDAKAKELGLRVLQDDGQAAFIHPYVDAVYFMVGPDFGTGPGFKWPPMMGGTG